MASLRLNEWLRHLLSCLRCFIFTVLRLNKRSAEAPAPIPPYLGRPYLVEIPPEIFCRIMHYTTTNTFLSIVQTCDKLRCIMQENGAAICNAKILCYFPLAATLLEVEMSNGWLLSTLESFRNYEISEFVRD